MQRIFILHKTTKLILATEEEREATSFQRLWEPPGNGDLLQIPDTGDLSGRQQLVGGGEKLVPDKGGVEEDGVRPQQGGGVPTGIRIIFYGHGTGGAAIQIGDLGGHPPHGQGLGGVSSPVGETAEEMDPAEDTIREVDIHLGGDGTGGGGVIDNGGLHQAEPENSRTVYCYAITVIPL